MLGKPRIRLNNLKTSLRFPCLGLNPIIDSINLFQDLETLSKELVRLSKLDSAVEMVNKNSSDASLCSAKPSAATPSS